MNNAQLIDFFTNLAHKPYCADDLLYGLKIRPKKTAINMQYIQGNQPCMFHYFFFDIDRSDAVMAWHEENLPMPYWTAQTQKNGHAHLCYKLEIPLCTSEFGSQKAIAYASKVQAGLANKLGADVGYSHLITKNPFHKDWRVTFWTEQAYTLDYLADFVELPKKLSKEQEVLGLGRNCIMFDTVRKWAYKAIRAHRGSTFDVWLGEVLKQCKNVNNAFLEPLLYSEVKATAKSIARYCWKKDGYHYQEFIDRQSKKGAIGGKISKRKPVPTSEATTKPWLALGISQSTYYRRKKLKNL
ncbi:MULTISPECIES: replication initiation protein [Acinetobacter]|jgi:hypothetical protein|uniref:Primase C-terminal 1 domain-containing protein n=3 Tax=Acinetobacter TaxID=469 RepID=R9B8X0_9GAMM|nr:MULTISPECIES: replication initiation protein [Acinetobacter]EOR11004.1 hypothetical protein I593_00400 [Acinetobacter tandoii DSM 14970 = CIP 107469]HAV5701372.1 plasmid replicase [Acinetobacter baumannii]HAV5728545.1 plasmid replicase [Acinetobacter baumannii]HAV5732425.1 plasmid replicase [Acinetobacter baumannii]